MSTSERAMTAHMAHLSAHAVDSPQPVLYLHKSLTHRLMRKGQSLHVLAGWAWITLDGRDILLRAGEAFVLKPGRFDAVVSSANGRTLVYEIR